MKRKEILAIALVAFLIVVVPAIPGVSAPSAPIEEPTTKRQFVVLEVIQGKWFTTYRVEPQLKYDQEYLSVISNEETLYGGTWYVQSEGRIYGEIIETIPTTDIELVFS